MWVANSLLYFLQFLNINLCDTLIDSSEETIKIIQYLDYFSLDNIHFDDIPWISIISWEKMPYNEKIFNLHKSVNTYNVYVKNIYWST